MDSDEPDPWSAVADGWARLWAPTAAPVWAAVLDAAGARPGHVVLDIGCGTGDLLAHAAARGLVPLGLDPAPGMLAHARRRLPGADLRLGVADRLPWPDGAVDLVTSVNTLHLADDVDDALAEAVRVTRPGGHVALAGWAEAALNDLDVLESAVAAAFGEESAPDPEVRAEGGFAALLDDAGLAVVASGLVATRWEVASDDDLVAGVLLGEDPATLAELAPVVVRAARPFRRPGGGYRLVNHHRWVVGRRAP